MSPELHHLCRGTAKPAYRVPLMSEIREIESNGLKVASLFAGCGGSSTGYRMAGFQIAWANEFVPIAQESYAANMDPRTILDGRDIATVRGSDILEATGLRNGELDILDGSPPCQAFSTEGKREKGWGTDRVYEHGASQKNEDLFFEYCRIRDEVMPRIFVAENVSGLIKGKAKGYFLDILKKLKIGYQVRVQVLDAQWLGVPQQRQRVIFIGVRDDIGMNPIFPKPLPYRYTVRDAIPWIIKVQAKGSFNEGFRMKSAMNPSQTIIASNMRKVEALLPDKSTEHRKFTIAELKRICSFPDDFILKVIMGSNGRGSAIRCRP
jgi:DNA (cytosine-5)-methyltransferase 1